MLDYDLLAPIKRHAAAIVVFFALLAGFFWILNREATKFRAEMEKDRFETTKGQRDRQEGADRELRRLLRR